MAQWQSLLAWSNRERVLAEQPAPMNEPAPEVVAVATEAAIERHRWATADDAAFITQTGKTDQLSTLI